MAIVARCSARRSNRLGALCVASILVLGLTQPAAAQLPAPKPPIANPPIANPPGGIGFFNQVGGISIQPDGLIQDAGRDAEGKLAKARTQALANLPRDFKAAVPLRKISLRGLEAKLRECFAAGKPLPEEVLLLGGLQQIRYVFAYPAQKDIVLVGPAEGWKVDAHGNIVGLTTGRPVMLLDDLVVALRTAAGAGRTGITCSIDPTTEGMARLRSYVAKLSAIGDREATRAAVARTLGRQQISFGGVPGSTHFAATLLAADYRMKRLAMGFEPSPVPALPSFLSMLGGSGHGMRNTMQRWWLEPKYESLLHDAAGLAWQLDGGSVRCVTEEEFFRDDATRHGLGKSNPLAQKWADLMTRHYGELALAEPVFGDLRNCMELAVVGAMVARIRAQDPQAIGLPVLLSDSQVKVAELPVAKQVETQTSMLKKGRNWIISASGGVLVPSWSLVEKAQTSDAAAAARAQAAPAAGGKWSWN